MALISSRALPASASARSPSRRSQAGWRAFIHSRIAHESSARVFKLPFPLAESRKLFHHIFASRGAPQFFPCRLFRKHDFLAPYFERELSAFRKIKLVANCFGDGDLPLGG